jgi:hypothetical protein
VLRLRLISLPFLLAADRFIEKDGADADADPYASTPAATTTAMAVVMLACDGALRVGA